MCELFCLSSRLPTTVTFSLSRFAARGGLDGRQLDGWGLAFYDGRDLRLYREPEPARASAWLPFIEQRRVPSTLVVSHIRHATRGSVCLANTQPFARELGGRMHCFAHNGMLRGEIRPGRAGSRRFAPVGETDSEQAACELVERMAALWMTGQPSVQQRAAVVREFAREMAMLGPANFIYSDSEVAFAHGHRRTQADGSIRPPGLWVLERHCDVDNDALPVAGVALAGRSSGQQLVLLASVPLTHEGWRPLEEGELVIVREGMIVEAVGR
ncbi:MAG: class II glutamine amidotransferase [Proteobacteria bacterium]|nr:class II glutamine amidotransferase [Pseudomonadota bacterium]